MKKPLLFFTLILNFCTWAQTSCPPSAFCPGYIDPSLPLQRTTPMVLGMNGAPTAAQAYTGNFAGNSTTTTWSQDVTVLTPIWKAQFDQLKKLGTNFYRIPVGPDAIGHPNWSIDPTVHATYKGDEIFKAYCAQSHSNGIQNILVLDANAADLTTYDPATQLSQAIAYNYQIGFSQASYLMNNVIMKMDASVRPIYYELSNEITSADVNALPKIAPKLWANIQDASTAQSNGLTYGTCGNDFSYNGAVVLIAYLRGLQDGLKSNTDPWAKNNIKLLFGSAGYHYGILSVINYYNSVTTDATKQFKFDILSWHWYSCYDVYRDANQRPTKGSMTNSKVFIPVLVNGRIQASSYSVSSQNTLQALIKADASSYGSSNCNSGAMTQSKDLWITEFGYQDFAAPNAYADMNDFHKAQVATVPGMIREMQGALNNQGQPAIKGLFLFALFNSYNAMSIKKWQDQFGVFDCGPDETCNVPVLNPLYTAVQNEFQYITNGYDDFVFTLFSDWGAYESPNFQNYYTSRLKCTQNTCAITKEVLNAQFVNRFFGDQYENILETTVPNSDIDLIHNQLSVDIPDYEGFKIGLMTGSKTAATFLSSSQRHYPLATAPNEAFMLNVFRILLNRVLPSNSRLAANDYWLAALNSPTQPMSKSEVLSRIMKSEEYLKNLVDQGFQLALKRSVAPVSNTDYWYVQLSNGSANEAGFLSSLFMSPEYRDRSKAIGVLRRLYNCTSTTCGPWNHLYFCNYGNINGCPTSVADFSVVSGPILYTQGGWKFTNNFGGYKGSVVFRKDLEETSGDISTIGFSSSPNPFSDQISVSYPMSDQVDIQVYNEMGEKMDVPIEMSSSSSRILDTRQLSSGIYLMRVVADGQVKTLHVIKR